MNVKSKLIALLAAIALVVTSCSDDDSTGAPSLDGTFQTIVTYAGSNDAGSSFTVTEPGTNMLTTFTSTKKFPTEGDLSLKVGTRVMIFYTNSTNKRYASGAIDLRGISIIFNGNAPAKPQSDISPLRVDYMDVSVAELSGTYINIVAQASVNVPVLFDIYVDETTVNDEIPEAFVVFKSDNKSARERAIYGSFNMASVWNLPTCHGIRLHYMTHNGPESQTFVKDSQPVQPMK